MMNNQSLFEELKSKAEYAARSYSRDLVYETLGMAKTLLWLEKITHEEYMELNMMLVRNCLNNGQWLNRADMV